MIKPFLHTYVLYTFVFKVSVYLHKQQIDSCVCGVSVSVCMCMRVYIKQALSLPTDADAL